MLRQEVRQSLVLDDHKLLNRIIEASQTMRTLIRRLRDYLLLDSVPLQLIPVDVGNVLREARERVGQQWPTADMLEISVLLTSRFRSKLTIWLLKTIQT